jgi:hypothetical protein
MPLFHRYIGIDYSGASAPSAPLQGLQVFVADRTSEPAQQESPHPRTWKWDRQRLASWLLERLLEDAPTIVGIDHAFSYPLEAMGAEARRSWTDFLAWFEERWPTSEQPVALLVPRNLDVLERFRQALRLADRWAPTAMPVCSGWEAQGPNVFFSTHAGIPWLRWLRQATAGQVHFWPFDGFAVPAGRSVVAEVYPRVFRRRYDPPPLTPDERDAWLVCRWLKDRDEKGCLAPYFQPPLDDAEARQARVEGWILGVA